MADKLLLASFFLTALLAGPLALLASSTPVPGQPVLVIVAPWATNVENTISAAQGDSFGPVNAPMAAFATSDDPEFIQKLHQAGAWAVIDGKTLAAICGA